jgi:putative tricarboxylic transport membrane protein
MYVGNLMLLLLNLPLVSLFVLILRVPYAYLYPLIIVFSIVGVYEVNHSSVDLWILLAMGALGYGLRKLAFDPAPLVLGLVISPTLELSLRQSLILSNGDARIFVERPIAAALFSACALPLVLSASRLLGQKDWRGRLARLQGGEP